jgi:hypothetical protein
VAVTHAVLTQSKSDFIAQSSASDIIGHAIAGLIPYGGALMPFPFLVPAFFLASWLTMIFWGMLSPGLGVPTAGYPTAMLATIAIWLIVFPLARRSNKRPGRGRAMRRMGPFGQQSGRRRQSTDRDTVNISTSFSTESQEVTSQNFSGGDVSANLGRLELDLRNARLSEQGAELNVRAFLGGVEIRVPADWDVEFDVTASPGGVEDKRSRPGARTAGAPRLTVTGSAFLGGVSLED